MPCTKLAYLGKTYTYLHKIASFEKTKLKTSKLRYEADKDDGECIVTYATTGLYKNQLHGQLNYMKQTFKAEPWISEDIPFIP